MNLQPLDDSTLDKALALLLQGFPKRSERYWIRGIERARATMPPAGGWPLGFLLGSDGNFEGVMLTFPSYRTGVAAESTLMINLSSWYVAPERRGLTVMMLMRLLSDRKAIYTDLTPSPLVLKMIGHLKFVTWNEGMILTTWPAMAMATGQTCEIVPLRDLPGEAVDAAERKLLEDHEELGCVAAALYENGAFAPLILHRTRLMGAPAGRILYAHSRRQMVSHLRPIARFALRHGMPLLAIDGDRENCPRGSIFLRRGIKAFRGNWSRDRIDYAYSEMAYLNHGL